MVYCGRKTKNSAKSDYVTALKECRALCAELVRDFRFAMSDKKNAIEYLAQYNKYRKNIDVSFDLRALAALGKKHTPLLEKINFDLSLLDRADAMGKDLMNKSSEDSMNIDKSRLRSLYNKACHYLKDTVSEVRRCGKYVFHGNKERFVVYRSEYRRLHKKRAVNS